MIKFGKETKPRLVEHQLSNPDRDPIEIYSVNISTLLISIFLCRIEYPRKKQQLLFFLIYYTTYSTFEFYIYTTKYINLS